MNGKYSKKNANTLKVPHREPEEFLLGESALKRHNILNPDVLKNLSSHKQSTTKTQKVIVPDEEIEFDNIDTSTISSETLQLLNKFSQYPYMNKEVQKGITDGTIQIKNTGSKNLTTLLSILQCIDKKYVQESVINAVEGKTDFSYSWMYRNTKCEIMIRADKQTGEIIAHLQGDKNGNKPFDYRFTSPKRLIVLKDLFVI